MYNPYKAFYSLQNALLEKQAQTSRRRRISTLKKFARAINKHAQSSPSDTTAGTTSTMTPASWAKGMANPNNWSQLLGNIPSPEFNPFAAGLSFRSPRAYEKAQNLALQEMVGLEPIRSNYSDGLW